MSTEVKEPIYFNPPRGGWANANSPPPINFDAPAKFDGSKRETRYGKRHIDGQMNGVETEYAQLLELRKLAGEIADWFFEAITLKLAEKSRHKLDFIVLHKDGSLEFVNVKGAGPIDPNSLTKIKTAAEKFYMFKFSMVQKLKKADAEKHGSQWKRREF